jgi:hypothetical protein
MTDLDRLRNQVGALEAGLQQTLTRTQSEPMVSARDATSRDDGQDEFLDLVGNAAGDVSGEPEWDVEVVPPIDIMKIMNIVSYLDGLSEVSRTEIIPRNDRTSIIVYVNRPVEMLDLIKALPEVEHAEDAGQSGESGKLKKISVALSVKNGVAEGL